MSSAEYHDLRIGALERRVAALRQALRERRPASAAALHENSSETTSGAIGAHFLRSKYNWSVELRFMHISNAGLIEPNPGINTLQVRVGFGRFTQPHQKSANPDHP